MSLIERLDKKIDNNVYSQISTNNTSQNIKSTTLYGYRSLGMHQLYKFGMGSASKGKVTTIDDWYYDYEDDDFYATE